ncbi:MAG: hypothetical protein C0177_04340 [Fervidicoccus fontis]|nr:MAG: hypothetical protein C0177_04340 [Fervidicoccus fontis]
MEKSKERIHDLSDKIEKTLKLVGDVEDELYVLPAWVSWVLRDLKEAQRVLKELKEERNNV